MKKYNNILIVAPHADDEILGCGGIISKFVSEGCKVYIAIMTNAHIGDPNKFSEEGINIVRDEALQAHTLLGVLQTFFFDFPAPRLSSNVSYLISDEISKLINQFNIDTVFLPHRGDSHIDHKVVCEAGLVATRPFPNSTVKNVFCYETLSETEWGYPSGDTAFIPNFFVSLNKSDVDNKISAMQCFKSQLREFPNTRSVETIMHLLKYRGSTVGKVYSEAFMAIRMIE